MREGVSTVDPELAVHVAVRRIIRASLRCGSCPKKTNWVVAAMTTRISISLGLLLLLFFISSLIQIHKEYGVAAATLQSDVIAVQQILRAWGEETPSLQQNWNANGSSNLLDPCGAQWVGVSCSPSAVQSQHADYSSITSLYYVFYYTLEHLYMHCCCSFASNNTESTAT